MKSFLLILIATLFVWVGCSNNPTGNRVPDINKTLVAKISTTASDTVLIGQAILFSGELSRAPEGDPIAKYEWSFGDGASSNGRMTQYKYNMEGNFTAQLKITTESGLADSTTKIMVVVDHFEEKTPTIYLESSQKQLDGSYTYRYRALKADVHGNKEAPYFIYKEMGSPSEWKPIAIVDTTGDYYGFSINSFDMEINLQFGGHYPDSWATIKYSWFYNSEIDLLDIIQKEGKIYRRGEAFVEKIPGETGDDVIRFSKVNNVLLVYFNNKEKIPGVKDQLFWNSVISGWSKPQTQYLYGSSGWGYTEIPLGDLPADMVIDLNFGGNFAKNSWAVIAGSYFYDPEKLCLSVRYSKFVSKTAGGQPVTLWKVVPAKLK